MISDAKSQKRSIKIQPKSGNSSTTEKNCPKSTVLKVLREKKHISRSRASKLTQLSPYEVEGLEREATQGMISKVLGYIKGLGYKPNELFHLIESGDSAESFLKARGSLQLSINEVLFKEGVKLLTYLDQNGYFIGQLQLMPVKNIGRDKIPAGDLIMGIVREGTLMIDMLVQQIVFKKDQFFVLPGSSPFEFVNTDGNAPSSTLIFSISTTP